METLVGEHYKDGHYHDAKEHGLAWAVLNELLHVIVFVYTLYGMINFRVKFIRMIWLVKWMSKIIIAHNWYLCAKFGLLAVLMYVYNVQLESKQVELASFNCSLDNYSKVVSQVAPKTSGHKSTLTASNGHNSSLISNNSSNYDDAIHFALTHLEPLLEFPEHIYSIDYMPHLNYVLDVYGGPFKLLGNRATLMYGFYSIAIFIMLAIFPIELMCFVNVGFNFTRFVLSDPRCMKDLYDKRKRHLCRLSSWSRNGASSLLTKGAKMILIKRDLRSNYTDDCNQLVSYLLRNSDMVNFTHELAARGGGGGGGGGVNYERKRFNDIMKRTAPGSGASAKPRSRNRAHLFDLAWSLSSASLASSSSSTSTSSSFSLVVAEATSQIKRQRKPTNWEFERPLPLPPLTASPIVKLGGSHNCKHYRLSKIASIEQKLSDNVKQLRTRLAINHRDKPSYQVCIANKNLERFKPFVRSDVWFKASMIIYPIFIFFYFSSLIVVIGCIEYYFESYLYDVYQACTKSKLNTATAATSGANNSSESYGYYDNWTSLDKLMYYENIYTVYLLSCASSFYCSYYFGTILELYVWLKEVSQQLELCAHVIGLNDQLTHSTESGSLQFNRLLRANSNHRCQGNLKHFELVNNHVNDFGGLNYLFPVGQVKLRRVLRHLRTFSINCLQLKVWKVPHLFRFLWHSLAYDSQYENKAKLRELMAIKMLNKRETLMRATYVNLCLFFDEVYETRFMTTTILRRTTQIASGFAFVASITRSQFKANYWHLTYLLFATFIVFNLYLACAAYINSGVSKQLYNKWR